MKKQVIAISSKELAQIIHSELIQNEVYNADEIYDRLINQKEGTLIIHPNEQVRILDIHDLNEY